MAPILFEIGSVSIYAYGFFLLVGLLAGLTADRRGTPTALVRRSNSHYAGYLCEENDRRARFYALFPRLRCRTDCPRLYRLFDSRIGPGAILGALAGAYFGESIASRIIGKAGYAGDAFAPATALAMSIGRIRGGC